MKFDYDKKQIRQIDDEYSYTANTHSRTESGKNGEINRQPEGKFNIVNRRKSANYYYLCNRNRRRTLKYRGVQEGAHRDFQKVIPLIPKELPPKYTTPGGSPRSPNFHRKTLKIT